MSKMEMKRLMCECDGLAIPKAMCTFDRESDTEPDDCMSCNEVCEQFSGNGCEECYVQAAFTKLAEYERTEHSPEQFAEFDKMYLAKCEEVNRLNAELGKLKKQPQGDLISRKAVMELIESKCIDGCLGTEDTTLIDAHGLIYDVSDIPTAYDVEKVVAELEKDTTCIYRLEGYIPKHKAIDIVRKGGTE